MFKTDLSLLPFLIPRFKVLLYIFWNHNILICFLSFVFNDFPRISKLTLKVKINKGVTNIILTNTWVVFFPYKQWHTSAFFMLSANLSMISFISFPISSRISRYSGEAELIFSANEFAFVTIVFIVLWNLLNDSLDALKCCNSWSQLFSFVLTLGLEPGFLFN